MPSTPSPDHQHQRPTVVAAAAAMAFGSRLLLNLRRNQVASADQYFNQDGGGDDVRSLDLFQSHVADRLLSLDLHLPSLPFLTKLLDAFLLIENEFKNLMVQNTSLILKSPPADKLLLLELVDRAVKSLDVCNELTMNLQSVHHWNRHADIAASALRTHGIAPSEGQLSRAKKALAKLLSSAEPSSQSGASINRKTERAWSFLNRNGSNSKEEASSSSSSSGSLSGTMSMGKQLQAMSANLTTPASNGLPLAVYTMSSALVFTVWSLVTAFVGPPMHLRQLAWAPAMIGMQERIGEEWRRRGRRGGVLTELVEVERCAGELMEAVVGCGSGLEVVGRSEELAEASSRLEDGLGPFERKLREVFHRVVRSREEVLRCLEESNKSDPAPFIVM